MRKSSSAANRLTFETPVPHPWIVSLLHRSCAVLLCLATLAGNAAVCAGWVSSADARLACCEASGHCAEHDGESRVPGTHRVLTQGDSDRCCASSERGGTVKSILVKPDELVEEGQVVAIVES